MRQPTLLLTTAIILSLFLAASCVSRSPPLGGGMDVEKVRLGSSPPICYNKCYDCSPCTAVQVPTLSAPAGPARARPSREADEPLATLSNYKPLGWKCQCRDRLYDP